MSIPRYVVLLCLFASVAGAQTTTPQWRPHTPLPTALTGHAVVLLPTGEVLVAGGIDAAGNATSMSTLYSSTTGRFRPTLNQLSIARGYHALIAATTGTTTRVFSIGGYSGSSGAYRSVTSIEVLEFDAAQSNWRWRPIASLAIGRGDLRAAWDGGASIIVTGGYQQTGGALRSGSRSDATDRINVATLAVTSLGSMNSPRAEHVSARFESETGPLQVLVAGGEQNPSSTATQIMIGTAWDPIANPPITYRVAGVGVGDPAGIARAFGGYDAAGAPLATSEWYDVKRGWRSAPRMITPRARFDATHIAGIADSANAYLTVAGDGTGGPLTETEIFELPNSSFPNGSWSAFPPLTSRASERRAAITASNLPIVVGGNNSGAINSTEIFQPLRASDVVFAPEEIGRLSDSSVVVIENTWSLPVRVDRFRIAGSAEFIMRGDTSDFILQPGGSRSVRVYFQPAQPGDRSGALLFDIGAVVDTVRLAGRGLTSTISIVNSPLDLGRQLIGTRRIECVPVLFNSGTDTATIDSIVISPSSPFRLVSPIGRAVIAPGDTLRICVEFAPAQQGAAGANASMHIASRTFPLQVLGRGIRRLAVGSTFPATCDTITYAPGVEIPREILIENTGDTVVTITLAQIIASTPGLFRIADPSLFPIVLRPGESFRFVVIYAPQRESQETATINVPNDGDSAISIQLCMVTRSRYLSVSQSAIDFGGICLGDTVDVLINIENPGGFDDVALLSADIAPAPELSISGFTAQTLGPRGYTTVRVQAAPGVGGPIRGALTIRSDRGDVVIPISGDALPSAGFVVDVNSVTVGQTVVLPVSIQGLATSPSMNTATLTARYDPTLLLPLRVVSITGAPAIDASVSSVVASWGVARVDVNWPAGGPSADGPAFGIELEVLRGDADVANFEIEGQTDGGLCIRKTVTPLDVATLCGGRTAGIRTDKAAFIFATPLPASEKLSLTIVDQIHRALTLDVVDATGVVVEQLALDAVDRRSRMVVLAVDALTAGAYTLVVRSGSITVATTRVLIAR